MTVLPLTEAVIQQRVLIALGARTDCRVWRQNAGTFSSLDGGRIVKAAPKGAADLTGLVLPLCRRLELEVKTKRGRESKAQKNWQALIERMGGYYAVVRSADEAIRTVEAAALSGPA